MLTLDNLDKYVATLVGSTGDLSAFGVELILIGTIIAMLIARVVTERLHMGVLAVIGTGLAAWFAFQQWSSDAFVQREIFQGLIIADDFALYIKLFLLVFTFLVILLTMLTGIPDSEDSADFHTLLLGSVIGMSLMASANNLLMIFLAVEMASVPSYAMAGFLKGRRQSSEAALKYVVYGGASAGVMLYGLTLLGGIYGSLHLPTIAREMLAAFSAPGGTDFQPALMLALMLILVGIAFKLAAFPFHFWCPDVFEGAAAEVAAFLSVTSKGAAVALVARFTTTLVGIFGSASPSLDWSLSVRELGGYLSPTLAVMAAVTCTFGNLAAYGQTNLKRLFAYSTIAHAGYMLMALVPLTDAGAKAALFYLVIYLFMNLGVFAVVAFVRNKTGSETLDAYKGLVLHAPWLTVTMSIFLLSLAGIPPFAGFVGKFQIFLVLYESGWYMLLVIGGLNSVLSIVYYVNIMRVMIIAGDPRPTPPLETVLNRYFVVLVALPVFIFGILWQGPENWSTKAADALEPVTQTAVVRQEAEKGAQPAPETDATQSAADLATHPARNGD